jgi:hypothetical protein
MALVIVLFCTVICILSIICYMLRQALAEAQKAYLEADRLWRETFVQMVKPNETRPLSF